MKLSLVIPVYNEEKNLPELWRQITTAVTPLNLSWDVTFVDDGSHDNSVAELKRIQLEDPRHIQVVELNRNYGQTAAISAGIDHSDGDVVILLDSDLQNDPADIPLLLTELEKGYDVVSGWRKDRHDNKLTRNLPSHVANSLISKVTGVRLHDYGCTLKAYRREILNKIRLYGEMHRFIPVYAYDAGARVTEVVVRHHARVHGKANYGLERVFKVILDLITVKFLMSYSKKPIYIFGGVGLSLMFVSAFVFLWLAFRRVLAGVSVLGSPWFQISVMVFILGFIAILLGLIAELLMRTYYESQAKPTYHIRKVTPTTD
ncbi:MAG TPA: glycosyltransferase family 2 protein [Anaerolineaceae bacterium]|nr:glycosyltransferase family 2 protein [Chloroflexota bacterium]HNY84701.1 glycosyltransferase family 2 protein [Anaerolineaceae bacterium]